MIRRARKFRNKAGMVILFFIAGSAFFTSFLPWVTVPKEIKKTPLPIHLGRERVFNHKALYNRLIFYSFIRIKKFSFTHSAVAQWKGCQLPGSLYNLRPPLSYIVGDRRAIRLYALAILIYPYLLMIFLGSLYWLRFSHIIRVPVMLACFCIIFVQWGIIGGKDIALYPVNFYLDYGYWAGSLCFLFFGIVLFRIR